VATTALVLVVPVVVAVTIGGFAAGITATATGFLVYDFVFIPPYYTLSVGAAENWVALAVYVVVMIVVARVVARLNEARAEAQLRAAEVRRLFDLSELLVRETSAPALLDTIVTSVRQAFDLDGAALLLPADAELELVASAGVPLSGAELHLLSANAGVPVQLGTTVVERGRIQAVVLTASGQAIGLLALRGLSGAQKDRELLGAFANHLALALERSQLREQAVRAELLEEVDRLRRSLVGAVSHDLRTPLATIKVSASTLLNPESSLSSDDVRELAGLIDVQADRLNRLVTNLLDMTRLQSGTLELRRQATPVSDLVDEAMSVLGRSSDLARVKWQANGDLPLVDVDHVLICQVLANLIDNATRYAPDDVEAAGPLPHLPGSGRRRGQDLRHARRGLAARTAGHRRRHRLRRDPRPAPHRGAHRGLEVVPRKVVEYRGTPSRRWISTPCSPAARGGARRRAGPHQRARLGRHEKRWQDVLELLDAGIDVITTVNIQHLESIADAVEQMTGAKVRERVPDWVVRKADQIELVDSSPEQLRRRMLHGNIYPPSQGPQRLTHFFRPTT
jgi:K+-sensing histidine kinase KdpD